MTKIIAVSLFATVLLATHSDADVPLTGSALGTATPNIASKHPDLHGVLADGTFDSMTMEQQIVFLHEPYFRDLAEFGLDTDAVDAERQYIAEMAGKLATGANTGPLEVRPDYFEKRILEMHAAMFVANDKTLALPNRPTSPQDAIRERHHVMDLQRRMLDDYLRTMEMAQDARSRIGMEPQGEAPPSESQASPNEGQVPSYDETYIQKRFNHHRKNRHWTPAQVTRSVVWRLGNYAAFAEEDRVLLQSIDDLDRNTLGRQAAEPIIQQLCALPANDVHGRARLMNEASQAENAALDVATTALLARLTADGYSRIEALVQSAKKRSSTEIDWEGIATDLPQVMQVVSAGACDRYDLLIGVEQVLDKAS